MLEIAIAMRNIVIHLAYVYILKPILFCIDPEKIHDQMVRVGVFLGSTALGKFLTRLAFGYSHPSLRQEIAGIVFENPVGLAAGFDKNAKLTNILSEVGFGFMEVGSITGEPGAGNARPRLWRHPEQKNLRVHYGLNNDGAQKISERLAGKKFALPMGVSMAKTNSPATVDASAAIQDYLKVYRAFKNIGAYHTINISCPNAFGGQPFTEPERLEALLTAIDQERNSQPVFLKLSPDLTEDQLAQIAGIADRHRVNGLICSNLTKQHNLGEGGLSGKGVADLSLRQIKYLRKKFGARFVLIACGGIFSAEDAYARIRAGASLVQLIAGMIFEGPQVISEINRGLTQRLKRDGWSNIAQAVGTRVTTPAEKD